MLGMNLSFNQTKSQLNIYKFDRAVVISVLVHFE